MDGRGGQLEAPLLQRRREGDLPSSAQLLPARASALDVDALKGWHVFRYSFISALASKGVDQRVIDDLVGH